MHPPIEFDAAAHRKWVNLAEPQPNSFSVMSYNLLSQHYVWKKVFEYLDPRYLDWPHYRFPLINKSIEQLPCDIMCFQELECLVYQNEWLEHFPLKNYELVYLRKPEPGYWGMRPPEFMDGVGIFVNKNRFDILETREVYFGRYVADHPERFDTTTDVRSRLIPRNTVALLILLYDKMAKKHLFVSNTHLYWLPEYNDVKLMQTKLLLESLAQFVAETGHSDLPLLMCGDFNSTPTSAVHRLLSEGNIDLRHELCLKSHNYGSKFDGKEILNGILTNPFSLEPAYGPLLDENRSESLDFTSFTRSLTAILDHIWLSKGSLSAYQVLGKVDDEYATAASGFPDQQFPSDHIPLISRINYL